MEIEKNLVKLISPRTLNFYGFLICCALLAESFYLQKYLHYHPCVLCVMQRYIVLFIATFFLFGSINPIQRRSWHFFYHCIGFLLSILGVIASGRQIWLQYYATGEIANCGASFEYIIQNFPLVNAMKLLMEGSTNCSIIDVKLFQLSLAVWMLFFFCLFAVICLFNMWRKPH